MPRIYYEKNEFELINFEMKYSFLLVQLWLEIFVCVQRLDYFESLIDAYVGLWRISFVRYIKGQDFTETGKWSKLGIRPNCGELLEVSNNHFFSRNFEFRSFNSPLMSQMYENKRTPINLQEFYDKFWGKCTWPYLIKCYNFWVSFITWIKCATFETFYFEKAVSTVVLLVRWLVSENSLRVVVLQTG